MAAGTAEPIRTAVIGLGRAGYGIHVGAMRKRSDFTITAVVDPVEERRREVSQELSCKAFGSLEECLAGDDAELVVVATVSSDHAGHSIAALKAGRHVLTEKPMATSVADADAMLVAARQAGRLLTVHQQHRLDSTLLYVQKLLHDGRLGDVFHIRRYSGGFARRNDWQTLRKYGGGSLNNNGVHIIDALYTLLESPAREVWGDLRRINAAGDAEDHVKVVIRGYNERVIDLELTSACALKQPGWVILGTRGTAIIDRAPKEPETATLKWYDRDALPPLEVIDNTAAAGRKYGVRETIPWQEAREPASVDPGPGFYDRLYASIREGAPLLVDPLSCRMVLDIMCRARVGTRFPD
jgi:scyllo-inositol 2-dehydrogenase (NADP+)